MGSRVRALGALAILALGACGLELAGPSANIDAIDDGAADATPLPADAAPPEADAEDADASSDADAPSADASDAMAKDTGTPCTEEGGKVLANNGHCYFPLTSPRTQGQAKADCVAMGAHLVAVTSQAEHTFLTTIGTGDRWIGLQAPAPSNDRAQYKWVTNEPNTVSYWYVNDPDNMGPCVALHGSIQEWVDRGCGDSNPAICERP